MVSLYDFLMSYFDSSVGPYNSRVIPNGYSFIHTSTGPYFYEL
jgi:hypothetical protein